MVMSTSRVLLVVDLLPVLERCAAARPCPQIHTHRLVRDGDVCLFFVLVTPVELVDNCQTPLSATFCGSGRRRRLDVRAGGVAVDIGSCPTVIPWLSTGFPHMGVGIGVTGRACA